MPSYTAFQPKRAGKRSKRIYASASGVGDSSVGATQPRLLPDTAAFDHPPKSRSAQEVDPDDQRDGEVEPVSAVADADAANEFLYDRFDPDSFDRGPDTSSAANSATVQEGGARFGSPSVRQGKDEMNLAEFPIARLGRNDTRLSIEYRGQIMDKLGNVIEQRWIVSGNATFGLPTEFADRVLVALMYITSKESLRHTQRDPNPSNMYALDAHPPVHNRPERRVPFTTYRILRLLGLTLNQRNYAAVEKALQQLVGVTIYSEDAFWDHQLQRRITSKKGFHILEEFWLKTFEGDDDTRTEAERQDGITGYVVWGERIWDSFQAGYIKNLDVEFYYALENTLARRLYRFLDKRMHYQQSYQIDIFDLAGRMGMKPYPFASQVARKLRPAFDELIGRGFLLRADVVRAGDFTRVRFERAPRPARAVKPGTAYSSVELDWQRLGDETVADAIEDTIEDTVEVEASAPIALQSTINVASTRTNAKSSQTATDGPRAAIDAIQVQSSTRAANYDSSPDFGLDPAANADHDSAPRGERLALPALQCEQLWANLLADYERTLPPATFAMLANSRLLSLEGNIATIRVELRYQEWLTRQMARQIKSHLNQQLHQLYSQLPEPIPSATPAWRINDVRLLGE